MNAVHTFPRDPNASVVASLRNSAVIAEQAGMPRRADVYRTWAEAAEQFQVPSLYQHFAREAAVWAAGQEVRS